MGEYYIKRTLRTIQILCIPADSFKEAVELAKRGVGFVIASDPFAESYEDIGDREDLSVGGTQAD